MQFRLLDQITSLSGLPLTSQASNLNEPPKVFGSNTALRAPRFITLSSRQRRPGCTFLQASCVDRGGVSRRGGGGEEPV